MLILVCSDPLKSLPRLRLQVRSKSKPFCRVIAVINSIVNSEIRDVLRKFQAGISDGFTRFQNLQGHPTDRVG